ncbi:SRPBCC domain-containing protein [Paenibacillus motobuensis]|uniref:SRPBCC domain-containing protein n=1 Tax=Paenibacillus TaxID=44249 RepID=UPI00203FBE75|nr:MULTISPECIES: SRPBCC domain-containing protein [Paenibacillus]MCM3039530.1 SRPBCC domain-containing protein [Paenibacillus lutimineralis]MCM3646634.1 SRPBCC domain-containing protein [Paenibacillus motobuensis]
MSKNEMVSRVENNRILVLERVFDAPRDLVFQMFKEPEHLKRWWGPRGWEIPVCNIDFRPGGVWHYCMKCVDQNQGQFYGMESWGKGVYKEIVEPEKIVYNDYFSDAEGNINESLPATLITMEFIDLDGKTKLVNRSEYASAEALKTVIDMGMMQGISETWDRLGELLESLK